jgi:hypothetical protein
LFSLSRSKTELSAFPLKQKKKPPLLQLLKAVFIGEGGSGDVAAHGEQGTPGEIFKQGAWGFKFWEQHAVINCFLFKGAWGSSSMRGEEQCQNDTVQNFFFIYIYLFFLFVGTQKWVTTDAPSL